MACLFLRTLQKIAVAGGKQWAHSDYANHDKSKAEEEADP
jgi:hypothetical protein